MFDGEKTWKDWTKLLDDNMSVWTHCIPKSKRASWEVQRVKCTKCEVEGVEGEVIEHFLYHELDKEEVPYLCRDCVYQIHHWAKAWWHREHVHGDPLYVSLEDTCIGSFKDLSASKMV